MQHLKHYIDAAWVESSGTRVGDIYNPALGKIIAQAVFADADVVEKAVHAAEQAFAHWSTTPPLQRARILFKYLELLKQQREALATCIVNEHGKTFKDACGSVDRGLEVVEFACGIPNLLKGSFAENVGNEIDCHAVRQPLGICVGITPFNFPAMVPLWMFPLAIACGNTFILKPSEKDPSTALLLAELFTQAGLPKGVLNVLHGDKHTVDLLLRHPKIAAVSFVGSTPAAEHVYQTATQHHKRVQALGGAKNHLLVMPDADLDITADALMGAAFGSAGERCMAISVAVVIESVADKLIQKLSQRIAQLKIGDGHAADSDMGPLITEEHKHKVLSYIAKGVEEGATLVVDGRKTKFTHGYFLAASLFDHVLPSMCIYREEIFGPVLSVVRVKDFHEGLALINAHEYGNGAAIFTQSGAYARAFSARVHAGMVGVNIPIPVPVAYQSFGGWKRSLFGDMHMHGQEGIHFYTKLKTITSRWPKQLSTEFHMPVF